jgi:hypothetical protein
MVPLPFPHLLGYTVAGLVLSTLMYPVAQRQDNVDHTVRIGWLSFVHLVLCTACLSGKCSLAAEMLENWPGCLYVNPPCHW